jgi:hypothetical protein
MEPEQVAAANWEDGGRDFAIESGCVIGEGGELGKKGGAGGTGVI